MYRIKQAIVVTSSYWSLRKIWKTTYGQRQSIVFRSSLLQVSMCITTVLWFDIHLLYLRHMQRLRARFATYIVDDLTIIVYVAKAKSRVIILLNIRAWVFISIFIDRMKTKCFICYFTRTFYFWRPVKEISYSAILSNKRSDIILISHFCAKSMVNSAFVIRMLLRSIEWLFAMNENR